VVSNLLDNAVKYTPGGGVITVSIEIEAGNIKVAIADTGIGINDSDIPHIFERFYRCDKSRSTSGSGLGLSLALAIIHAHGGDITVQSSEQGSTFSFFLPVSSSQVHS
jgi:signal transduction histidine kinase